MEWNGMEWNGMEWMDGWMDGWMYGWVDAGCAVRKSATQNNEP